MQKSEQRTCQRPSQPWLTPSHVSLWMVSQQIRERWTNITSTGNSLSTYSWYRVSKFTSNVPIPYWFFLKSNLKVALFLHFLLTHCSHCIVHGIVPEEVVSLHLSALRGHPSSRGWCVLTRHFPDHPPQLMSGCLELTILDTAIFLCSP